MPLAADCDIVCHSPIGGCKPHGDHPNGEINADDSTGDLTAPTPVLQALRQTQLSASIAHAQARQDAREPSPGSQSQKSRSRRTVNPPIGDSNHEIALKEIATKLVVVCLPWSEQWAVHGVWIVRAPADKEQAQQITGTDDLGIEILSHIPPHLVGDFFSAAGQSLVSFTMNPYTSNNHVPR